MKSTVSGMVGIMWCMVASAWAGPRDAQWKQVDEAVAQGLPQTACERLQPIIDGALRDKAYPEAIKAIARRLVLEGTIEGNRPEERIQRLSRLMADSPAEIQPLLHALQALWFWHYFQENQWRFLDRTRTAEPPGEDFTTWDLPRLFAEIDRHFQAALADEARLQSIPVGDYAELLAPGTVPDPYRPTLYDFLAQQALSFYASGEQAGAQPADLFVLEAESPALSSCDDFLAWNIMAPTPASPVVRGLQLYQRLLKFHRQDRDPSALADADLARLNFAWNEAVGEEKESRYRAALRRFVEQWSDHEISALARHQWANQLWQAGEAAEARRVALPGRDAFPQSPGGKLCGNLIRSIEAPEAQIQIERVWNSPWPTIDVTYRNVTEVHFRAYRVDWEKRLDAQRYRPEQLTADEQRQLVGQTPTRSWSAPLPPTADYRQRRERLEPPADLPPGFYLLVASHQRSFTVENNVLTVADFWISSLAVVLRTRWDEPQLEGFVLDARTGEPLAGARVRTWLRRGEPRPFGPGPTLTTDRHGLFRLTDTGEAACLLLVEHAGQQLAISEDQAVRRVERRPDREETTVFFTDRALYRPGQTIQYKGICVRNDRDADRYETLAGHSLTVVLSDVNGQEISRQRHRTNDYGSFSGSFTAPRDRLLGQMALRTEDGPAGGTEIRVEEYKRPKFEVQLEPPAVPPRLGAPTQLSGQATAYTGVSIDGARVRWRVVREVRYPGWWELFFGWRSFPRGESQEIAQGTTVTGADGRFTVEFVARPDRSVPEKDEPVFHYAVTADVTDTAGETRSGQRNVAVGYTALQATVSADEWQTADRPVALRLATQAVDGPPQRASGKLTVVAVRQPAAVLRPPLAADHPMPWLGVGRGGGVGGGAGRELPDDPSDPQSWPDGEQVFADEVTTDAQGQALRSVPLPVGLYRARFETQDRAGKSVQSLLSFRVLDPQAPRLALKVPSITASPAWQVEPGQTFRLLWGSGYDGARAFVEVEHRQKLLQAFWTPADRTQVLVEQAVTEAQRGGFTVRVTMVRENRAYLATHQVVVPWSNKDLQIKWEHRVSKLVPGQRETWTAVITGPEAQRSAAEMVATLYDASLDAFQLHGFPPHIGNFRVESSRVALTFDNRRHALQPFAGQWSLDQDAVERTYRDWPEFVRDNLGAFFFSDAQRGFGMGGMGGFGGMPVAPAMALDAGMAEAKVTLRSDEGMGGRAATTTGAPAGGAGERGPAGAAPTAVLLGQVAPRKNLQETAFFFPHLLADEQGRVRLEFTMPEALTRWRLLGLAHDRQLRAGVIEAEAVTAKDLMVQPQPPRFVREGDELEFTVKVSNRSPTRQIGTVRLHLTDAGTGESRDQALGNTETDRPFDIPVGESRSVAWRLKVADGLGPLAYQAVGGTERVSDGEEGWLPVLPRRVLVIESLPLPIRGPQQRKFELSKLVAAGESPTLQHQSLTLQMVSQPAWYGVMALPYLMEFPYECSEQTFNRLYANALARHIAASDPRIRQVFEQWRGTATLDSPLEQHADLKQIVLEETPWVRQAKAESAARRQVGILFDANRLDSEQARALQQLAELQRPDGSWPWFPGGPANDYITLYITTGFGRLRRLGVDIDVQPALRSLERLDAWMDGLYRDIQRRKQLEQNQLSPTIALYLYGRAFFLADQPLEAGPREAWDYFLGQARKHWLKLDHRQSQAQLALALHRSGDTPTAQAILRSLKERSVASEELGRFWRDRETSWWWYRAPIETQAVLIEAFDEVVNDATMVDDCQTWLLKQKQTQDWRTTKATADAVYALLLRGPSRLTSTTRVAVTLGDVAVTPDQVEAGTGFYEQRFLGGQIKPALGHVTVTKSDRGVAWGSLHWQYLEDAARVTPFEGTPLRIQKTLYVKEHSPQGPVLKPVTGPLEVGAELVVRLELRTDRDLEYVHLKDQRGSGTEPLAVLSQYRYQDGLAYYESTRDAASHFFLDYVPQGTYVFEYSVRVVHRGRYQSGLASIQCLYAPEFTSHSASHWIEVR
ncbi:MAG: alpha-2-macroglobulin family protein [Pirellulales bacterium]